MEKQRQERIIKLLTEKGATQPCPRCNNEQFELIGEANLQLKPGGQAVWEWMLQVPIILLACKNCGYIAQHAEKVLNSWEGFRALRNA